MRERDIKTFLRITKNRHVPGRDRSAIHDDLYDLERLLKKARSEDPGTKAFRERVLQYVASVHRTATRVALENDVPESITLGCYDIIKRTAEVMQRSEPRTERTSNRVLIQRNTENRERIISTLGVETEHFAYIPYSYANTNEEERVFKELRQSRLPISVEKEYLITPLCVNEEQWNLDLIGAPNAWNATTGEGIKIGIVDTGCDYDHEELKKRFEANKGYNFVDNNDNPRDDNGHGTHVGGTAAGDTVGVATGSTLYALKFLDWRGYGYEVDFIRAAEWAITHELDILNGSFGSGSKSGAEKSVCDELQKRGILFAAAAGNDGTPAYNYPASYESVLSVAAIDKEKQRADFSQRNDRVNLAAPGVAVRSCIPGGYDIYSGTSMATPHVTGSLALLKSATGDDKLTREMILATCEELEAKHVGKGLVRPDLALYQELKRRIAA